MIALQPITENNFEDVLKLKASEEFVATNAYSLAEAYCSLKDAVETGEPYLNVDVPYAIVNDKTVVGFLMVSFENGKDVGSDDNIYWISRIMLDEKYQGKGYGKAAMALLIDYVKTKPNGNEAKYIYTSHIPNNHIAAKTYAGFGFEKTGQMLDGECVMRLIL